MKQQKYYVFTKKHLEAMLKMSNTVSGYTFCVARFESAGKNYPGQLQFSKDFEKKIYENWEYDEG